ncbi:MAG: hypothetical protein HOM55_06285 [Proteobacteria bacterium]|jgi:ubiquinone biosynthesis accessory factor UbiJ|nr:hypothetical protein [Pseudomonadota bacterium]
MLIGLIENAGKNVLATDPETLASLAELSGQIVAVEFRQLDKTLYLRPVADGIELELDTDLKANVTFSASPSVFLRVARNGLDTAEYAPGELEIRGDAILGQKFAKALSNIDTDWEELLSQQIGDVPARLISKELQKLFQWASKQKDVAQKDAAEFLLQRAQIGAQTQDVDRFIAAVDSLASQAERFAAKLAKLESRL